MAPQIDGSDVPIVDIRQQELAFSLLDDIREGLQTSEGSERTLPTLLLYDEVGLKLFEDITYLDQYYLTNEEIDVITKYAAMIEETIRDGSLVVELGRGYDNTFMLFQCARQEHLVALEDLVEDGWILMKCQQPPESQYIVGSAGKS